MHGLTVIGLSLEFVGLATAGYGFLRTFRDVAPRGERVWSPAVRGARRMVNDVVARIDRWMRRIFKRPRGQTIAVPSIGIGGSFGAGVRVTTSFPSVDLHDHGAALVQLVERTNELRRMVEDAQYQRTEEDTKLREGLATLQSRIDDELGLVREERRAQSLADSRWQFGGLLLILLGLVLQTVGQLVQSGALKW